MSDTLRRARTTSRRPGGIDRELIPGWTPELDREPYMSILSLAEACRRGDVLTDHRHHEPATGDRTDEGEQSPNERLVEPLRCRELEVLQAMCDGDSNLDICKKLDIGIATVKYHINQIFGKLGVRRRTQAVAVAIHLGIVRPDWLGSASRATRRAAGQDKGVGSSNQGLAPNDAS